MSGDLTLPDDAVYKKYDEAIAHMDDVDDVETAVGAANKSQSSRPDSVSMVIITADESKLLLKNAICRNIRTFIWKEEIKQMQFIL